MSSITNSLFGGGGSGMAFRAEGAPIASPVTTAQANTAYDQTQAAIAQQQAFANAVAGQNGLANQTAVYNQLQGVANGTGPNPAQAQLAQATGTNISNQAALMAGERGSNANAGLLARQAAMQGSAIQQQAAGQAASLQANQGLTALNNMGAMATNQANQQANANKSYADAALGQQQNLLGGVAAQNNANVAMQSNMNTANAGLAGNVSTQQGNMFSGLMGGVGSGLMNMGGGMFGGGASSGGGELMAGGAGDAIGGIGDGATMLAAKGGMVPHRKMMADGGSVAPAMGTTSIDSASSGPQSNVGKFFHQSEDQSAALANQAAAPPSGGAKVAAKSGGSGGGNPLGGLGNTAMQGLMSWGEHEALPYIGEFFGGLGEGIGGMATTMAGGAGDAIGAGGATLGSAETGTAVAAVGETAGEVALAAAEGGKVPALVSPGEQYLPPKDVEKVVKGKADPLSVGERIPGKPKVPGNSYANDTVPKTLESGGIVIPNAIMQSKNPHWEAMRFVQAHMAKNGRSLPKKGSK